MSTIPALDPCTDILDTDLLLITHTNGNSEKMTGAEFNKRGQVIISANATLTGTPLKTGNVVRVLFTADQSAANSSAAMVINYNTVDITVKVCKNGALANFTPFEVSSGVYKHCQAYTAMELVYDGTYFIILGNPVVLSDADTTTFADGLKRVNTVAANNKGMVTSDAVASLNNPYEKAIPSTSTTGEYQNYYIAIEDIDTNNSSQTDALAFLLSERFGSYLILVNPWYTTGTRLEVLTLYDEVNRYIEIIDCAWSMSSVSQQGKMKVFLKIKCASYATKITIKDIINKLPIKYNITDIGNDSASYEGTTIAAYFETLQKGIINKSTDKQNAELSSPITVGGTSYSTVETALAALASAVNQ